MTLTCNTTHLNLYFNITTIHRALKIIKVPKNIMHATFKTRGPTAMYKFHRFDLEIETQYDRIHKKS